MDYPTSDATKRPFRLYNPKTKTAYRWRYYTEWRRAVNATFIELKWAAVGTVIEVIDIRTSKLLGQYKRTINSVTFHKESGNGKSKD